MSDYICHSGGCPGADMCWENEGLKYGVKTIAYSFWNHKQEGRNPKVLTNEELQEGFEHVLKANETIKRYPQGQPQYVKNLLARNWFQVKNSDAIFAVGKFQGSAIVSGGTGWAVQMAVDNEKFVYVFDQISARWSWYHPAEKLFVFTDHVPELTKNFAGIGTREINQNGIDAIKEIYKNTFASLV